MNRTRLLGAAIISLTGLVLSAIAGRELLSGVSGIAGLVIAGATLLLGVAFVVAGPAAYRADVQSRHLLRIAGWNTLGVVVTTAVLGLVLTFQAATAGSVAAPLLSGALIVGVSAFAHVLIGFNDVRRIRAQTVANQRQKAAVINRFVRHDLRHTAQLLIGYGEHLSADEGQADTELDIGQRVLDVADELSSTQSQVAAVDELLESDEGVHPVALPSQIRTQVTELRERYPDATVEVDVPDDVAVLAGSHVEVAFEELLRNAFTHSGDTPSISVTGERTDGTFEVTISDSGPGFPEKELALINDDDVETQLKHSNGLGLWLSKWVLETYDGSLTLRNDADGQGSSVTVELPVAA